MNTRLFIGNLSYQAEEADLTAAFAECGLRPTSVKIIRDRESGNSRGFAFVDMDAQGAQAAIDALNSKDFGGRELRVDEAREKGGGGRF